MRNLWMVFIIGLVILGCTYFEISNEIKPKVTIIGKEVGLIYKLGDLIISDTIKPNREKRDWLAANKDTAQWTLYVKYDGENYNIPYFYYYVNGVKFVDEHGIKGISEKILLANMESIEGFYLYKINGEKVGEKDEKLIKKELAKVKKEVKESGIEDKYKAPSKW